MRRFFLLLIACLLLLAGCDVPSPPPEMPTPTPGSTNPEKATYTTPVAATPERGFTPLDAPLGHIYFLRDDHLWTIDPEGTNERQLSDVPATGAPVPSFDGKQIAWVGGKNLYVMSASGGAARVLYTGELADYQRLGWSHDQTVIGFITYDLTQVGTEIAWAIPVAGGDPILLTHINDGAGDQSGGYERMVQWPPDDHWVLVGGPNNPMTLLRWPIGSGLPGDTRTISGGEADWSPDNQTILYTETMGGAVLIYNINENAATPFRDEKLFVGTGLGSYAQGPGPLWSPASVGSDSDILIYRSHSASGEPNVAVRTRGGRDLVSLPDLTNNPAWSPSGDKLVVETGSMGNDTLGPKWTPSGLSIVTISLTEAHQITPLVKNAQWPAWGK
jgi:Tol biopolymer transport system component